MQKFKVLLVGGVDVIESGSFLSTEPIDARVAGRVAR
jgi:hypothetical protein